MEHVRPVTEMRLLIMILVTRQASTEREPVHGFNGPLPDALWAVGRIMTMVELEPNGNSTLTRSMRVNG